jgi:hypothetical protein
VGSGPGSVAMQSPSRGDGSVPYEALELPSLSRTMLAESTKWPISRTAARAAQPSSWRNAQRISSMLSPLATQANSFMRAACGLRKPTGMIAVSRRSFSEPG